MLKAMDTPIPNGSNGASDRNSHGQFLPGNQAAVGHGNPHADKAQTWRTALAETVTENDLRAVIAKLVEKARAGERWAVREVLDRCLGKAVQPIAAAIVSSDRRDITLKLKCDEPRKAIAGNVLPRGSGDAADGHTSVD